jgi:hypothetical protein
VSDRDVLVEQANQSLRTRGFAPEEARVVALEPGDAGEAVLRGTLLEEMRARKGELLLAISSLPSREELLRMRRDLAAGE